MPRTTLKNAQKETSWYKRLEILIPIIISFLSLSYSIINGYRVEVLSRDVYVPKLEYAVQIANEKTLIIEISNKGLQSAESIEIQINWLSAIELEDCTPQPPYQDMRPIQPVIPENLVYRLASLPIEGSVRIACRIQFMPEGAVAVPIPKSRLTPPADSTPEHVDIYMYVDEQGILHLLTTPITITVRAKNAEPAIGVGQPIVLPPQLAYTPSP